MAAPVLSEADALSRIPDVETVLTRIIAEGAPGGASLSLGMDELRWQPTPSDCVPPVPIEQWPYPEIKVGMTEIRHLARVDPGAVYGEARQIARAVLAQHGVT